jgi:hypothetical protein
MGVSMRDRHQLLRTSYLDTRTDDQLERVLDTLERVGKAAGLIQ